MATWEDFENEPFCWVAGGEGSSVKASQLASICLLILASLTGLLQMGQSTRWDDISRDAAQSRSDGPKVWETREVDGERDGVGLLTEIGRASAMTCSAWWSYYSTVQ